MAVEDTSGGWNLSLLGNPQAGQMGILPLLGAAMMEYGNARQKKPAGLGLQMLMGMQKIREQQDAKSVMAQAAQKMIGKPGETKAYDDGTVINWNPTKPDMAAGLSLLGSNSLTAPMALQMMPEVEKLKKTQALNDMILGRLGGGGAQPPAPGTAAPMSGGAPAAPAGAASGNSPASPAMMGGGQPNGAFPFSLNEVIAIDALGGPKMLDAYKYANDGTKFEAGSYRKDPMSGRIDYFPEVPKGGTVVNGRVVAMPGAAEVNAGFEGQQAAAQERAKAAYDVVPTYGPGVTQPTPTTRLDLATGGAGAQGGAGSAPRYMAPNSGDQAYENETAKGTADLSKQIQAAGKIAPNMKSQYQAVGQLLADYDGSKYSPNGVELARVAKSYGFNVDPKLANKEAAQALTNELALQLRNPSGGAGMPGAMSDQDRQFLSNIPPGLAQTADGRKQIIDMRVKMFDRDADIAKMAGMWERRYGRLDRANPATGRTFFDNLSEWANRNPLFAPQQ